MKLLNRCLNNIAPIDRSIKKKITARLDSLTKPKGSLGRLEETALKYCLSSGSTNPPPCRKRLICFAGDHGVADEGVSAYPREVTAQMVSNIVKGGSAVGVLSRHTNTELVVVDIGVNADLNDIKDILHKKIRMGTSNITHGPAMSLTDTIKALETGIALANEAKKDGVTLLGTGDMGIANTTSSSVLCSALLKLPPEKITGAGTGVSGKALLKKINVVKKALKVNAERLKGPLNIMSALGGFEIAGICGLILGGAANRIPVVVDGFISSAAAVCALKMNKNIKDHLFFGHLSGEKGHRIVLEKLGVKPLLELDMRLGEGTGAVLAMSIVEAGLKIYREMATFSSAEVSERK